MGVGRPRLDPYQRMLNRFYEPLLLILLLNHNVLGPHRITSHDPSSPVATQRRFLRNLAYLCDFYKGGEATTAIGVEDCRDCYRFWFALNGDDEHDKVLSFITSILFQLRILSKLPEQPTSVDKDNFVNNCIRHAASRVKKEARTLSSAVRNCIVEQFSVRGNEDLSAWLDRFIYNNSTDVVEICNIAFQSRQDPMMRKLNDLCQLSEPLATDAMMTFRRVRHYIGRLGHRLQAINELVQDAKVVKHLLEAYDVARVPLPESVPPPQADGHTTLKGIFRRMIRPHDDRWELIEGLIPQLNRLVPPQGLEAAIVNHYEKETFRPRVHAEIQVLEHFHHEHLQFAAKDRFIATSKLACVCCRLYFQHHPARCVVPESHEKIYANWGPIYLPEGRDHPDFEYQRRLMSKITDEIREAALDRVFELAQPWPFHHDSMTELTSLQGIDFSSAESSGGDVSDEDSDTIDAESLDEPNQEQESAAVAGGFRKKSPIVLDGVLESEEDTEDGGVMVRA